jgi:hypothetical protein
MTSAESIGQLCEFSVMSVDNQDNAYIATLRRKAEYTPE